jgi:hypothetical protein
VYKAEIVKQYKNINQKSRGTSNKNGFYTIHMYNKVVMIKINKKLPKEYYIMETQKLEL